MVGQYAEGKIFFRKIGRNLRFLEAKNTEKNLKIHLIKEVRSDPHSEFQLLSAHKKLFQESKISNNKKFALVNICM